MPYASHWKCHHCHHLWSLALYDQCNNCYHRRCEGCRLVAIRTRSNNYPTNSNATSEAHTQNYSSIHPNTSAFTLNGQTAHEHQPESVNQRSESLPAPNAALGTDIYICCQCGGAPGPQVWQHNRKCSGCGHTAGGCCFWYK
jgi:hypothetical protein